MVKCGLDSSGSVQEPVAGCCEHGNESSGSIKDMDLTRCVTVSFSMTQLHGVSE
jgi:hypothetical protein